MITLNLARFYGKLLGNLGDLLYTISENFKVAPE